jgi:hypothetical protein
MPDAPEPAPPPAAPEALVDTSPSTPDRSTITYAILFIVLASLLVYFALHVVRSP